MSKNNNNKNLILEKIKYLEKHYKKYYTKQAFLIHTLMLKNEKFTNMVLNKYYNNLGDIIINSSQEKRYMDKVFKFILTFLDGCFHNDGTVLTKTGTPVRHIFHMFFIVTLKCIEESIHRYKIIYFEKLFFQLSIKYPDYYLIYILTKK